MLNLNHTALTEFRVYLQERECSRATIEKYMRDVRALAQFSGGQIEEKSKLLAFKEHLRASGYAISSINSMLAAVNCFLSFFGYDSWKLRFFKVQRKLFVDEKRELSRDEYEKMLLEADRRSDKRLFMLLQTICSTGIRVSELPAVTVESLHCGQARIHSKGKVRLILLPAQLCRMLKRYCKEMKIRSGSVFITKKGHPLDRSNIWKMMKRLAAKAGVGLSKVFPHNLRHLFACTYYGKFKDIVRLADILGHSSINTTRIYTTKNMTEQTRQMDKLSLLANYFTT